MLDFTCPTCGKRVQGDDSLAGKFVLCPVCSIATTAPQATPRSSSPTTAVAAPEHAAQAKITTHAGATDSAFSEGLPPLDPSMPPVRESRSHPVLAGCYGIHGAVVGGLQCLSTVTSFQAMTPDRDMDALLTALILQPVPMFIVALALWLGWRWAWLLAVSLPVVLAISYVTLVAPYLAVRMPPHAVAFQFYIFAIQTSNIPGATILAIFTAIFSLRGGR